jgi:hypothetical protein
MVDTGRGHCQAQEIPGPLLSTGEHSFHRPLRTDYCVQISYYTIPQRYHLPPATMHTTMATQDRLRDGLTVEELPST